MSALLAVAIRFFFASFALASNSFCSRFAFILLCFLLRFRCPSFLVLFTLPTLRWRRWRRTRRFWLLLLLVFWLLRLCLFLFLLVFLALLFLMLHWMRHHGKNYGDRDISTSVQQKKISHSFEAWCLERILQKFRTYGFFCQLQFNSRFRGWIRITATVIIIIVRAGWRRSGPLLPLSLRLSSLAFLVGLGLGPFVILVDLLKKGTGDCVSCVLFCIHVPYQVLPTFLGRKVQDDC